MSRLPFIRAFLIIGILLVSQAGAAHFVEKNPEYISATSPGALDQIWVEIDGVR